MLKVWPSHCPPGCGDTRGLEGAAEKQVKNLGVKLFSVLLSTQGCTKLVNSSTVEGDKLI